MLKNAEPSSSVRPSSLNFEAKGLNLCIQVPDKDGGFA